MAKKPLLDIGGVAPARETIHVRTSTNPEGSIYELRNGDELSPQEFAEILRMGKAIDEIELDEDDLDPAKLELMGNYVDRILEIAIPFTTPLSDDAKRELTIDQKLAIIEAFTVHCLADPDEQSTTTPNRAARRAKPPKKSTGAK